MYINSESTLAGKKKKGLCALLAGKLLHHSANGLAASVLKS